MAFNMAWFKAQEEKKRQEELAKRKALDPNYVEPETTVKVSDSNNETVYYEFHKNKEKNPHYFLSEELLVPRANNSDTQRLNMFSSHVNQLVHLKTPEFPRVFTNFENQIGSYSVAYKKADATFDIVAKIVKNQYNYDLIVKYRSSGLYDIIHFNHAKNITEDYGYALNDCISEKEVGDTVYKDEFVYKSDNYDDDGNFSYGVNLKAIYTPWKNLTYEDGIVISESAAEKLKSYKVEKTMFSVNTNDILLNLYGDDSQYKSFPKVGDHINSKVLVASRRRDKRTILYDFQATKLKSIDPVDDEVIYTGGGTVVDINIFNNIPIAELRKKTDVFSQEVLTVLEDQYRYWKELAAELEKIIPVKQLTEKEQEEERKEFGHVCKHPIEREKNPNKYSDELAYYWKLAHENIDERISWRFDGKAFDHFKMQFIILKENPLTCGCKLTGRYGNKGIIALIEKDENMPVVASTGEKAEVLLNPLGVIGRLNMSQLQEQYINFMSDHVVALMKTEHDYNRKADIFFGYIKMLNKEQYDFLDLEYIGMNRNQRQEFIDEIEEKGIYIHQPPFFGNTTPEQFERIFREHPEWCDAYKFEGIEKPMVMGDVYFVRLKHESSNKMSMRSATNLNVKNLPAKSTLKKEKKILYSSTPIRVGEMEVTNTLLTKRPDIVEKFLKSYSTNEEAREEVVSQLLCPGRQPSGHLKNALNMDLDISLENKSISREILDKYLNVLGYTIIDTTSEDDFK